MPNTHTIEYRVYYEDTDTGGVVYYANYLKFAERARTEMLRERGIDQIKLSDEQGIIFVVRNAEIDFKKPARLDDIISIETEIEEISGPKIIMKQSLSKGPELLVEVKVKVACITKDFRPVRIPGEILKKIH